MGKSYSTTNVEQYINQGGSMNTKLCKELIYGDRVIMADGSSKTVKTVTPGIYEGQKMINFTDGEWSHAFPKDKVEIAA